MRSDRLAAQLYTLRDYTKTAEGLRETLRKVSELGYKAVQLSAVGAMSGDSAAVSAATARKWLDEFGLTCIATHRAWEALKALPQEEMDFHQALGCNYTAIGSVPSQYAQTEDGYRSFLADAAKVVDSLRSSGLRFGLHNHATEFFRLNGKTGYDLLLEEAPDGLMFEVDTYWVAEGGEDPAGVLTRAAGKVPVIHVKDRLVRPQGASMEAVGEGEFDWETIVKAGDASGVEHYVVEQDICGRNAFDCLHSSFEYLTGLPVG